MIQPTWQDDDGSVKIYQGDALAVLKQMPEQSVHCVVTSPPYWALRSYLQADDPLKLLELGSEPTPEEYVAKLVEVFREVKRVLRDDGTVWCNMGDSYNAYNHNRGPANGANKNHHEIMPSADRGLCAPDLKPKDLCGMPWRLAFALQADGWVLRQEIIWHKKNPMPESCTDRCTKAHEQLFMFVKAKWAGPPPAAYSHISDADARWLATLIDAEGCIAVKRVNHDGRNATYAPQISIGNTHKPLMDKVAAIAGHGNVLERAGTNAPMHYWQLSNAKAHAFLYRIYPHLIVKPRQARIAMHVHGLTYYRGGQMPNRKMRTDAEEAVLRSLWEQNKACNQFGEPDLSDVPEPQYGRWAACERYYYDADAVREPHGGEPKAGGVSRPDYEKRKWIESCDRSNGNRPPMTMNNREYNPAGRNRRSVWSIPTQPYAEAHFATFPTALVEPCIMAGTSERGCCPECGKPWVRVVKRTQIKRHRPNDRTARHEAGEGVNSCGNTVAGVDTTTLGWRPSCECGMKGWNDKADFIHKPWDNIQPCTVLDPFMGSGTTLQVARWLGRHGIGIELNAEYIDMAIKRIYQPRERQPRVADAPGQMQMFEGNR